MHRHLVSLLLVFTLTAVISPARAAGLVATGEVASTQDGLNFDYNLLLSNAGTTTIGTLWFAFAPGEDFMDVMPTFVISPSGWTSSITNGGPGDGFGIQWVAQDPSDYLAAGKSLVGFGLGSSETPNQLLGNSSFYPGTPELTSFAYFEGPFSDPEFLFVIVGAPSNILPTVGADGLIVGSSSTTPIPATLPLFASGAGLIGLLARRRKRKAQAVA